MSSLEIILRIIAGSVLIVMNAFFVVTEFALTRLRQFDRSELEDHRGLRRAWEMTERLEIYLTGCQLGITSTSILMGVIAEPAISSLLRPLVAIFGIEGATLSTVSVVISVILINLVHKIWGEQAPTYLGVERPREVAKWAAPIHYWWCKIMYPVIYAGDGVAKATLRLFGVEISRSWTADEGAEDAEKEEEPEVPVGNPPRTYAQVRQAMNDVLSGGGIPRDRRKKVLRTLDIGRIPVQDVMVPREEVIAPSTERDLGENLRLMRDQRGISRFPLIGKSLDEPRGILYVSEVFRHLDQLRRGNTTLAKIATPPLIVAADLSVSDLIDTLQEARQEVAFVRRADEHVVGWVTVTDALEAIAGDLQDPFDARQASVASR